MKIQFVLYFLLIVISALTANDTENLLNKINIKNADETTNEELQNILNTIDLKSLKIDEVLEIVKNTSGFDFIDYLIKNESKNKGSTLKWDGNVSKITDIVFKEKILKAKDSYSMFKKKYKNIDLMRELRTKAINYLCENNSAEIKNKDLFYSYLQPKELTLFKVHEKGKIIDGQLFDGAYSEYYNLRQKVFFIKHNLPLQSEIQKKVFTPSEILNLMFESNHYVRHYNIDFLEKIIIQKDNANTWEDLLLAIKLWKDFDTYETYLFEDNLIHRQLGELMEVTFGIISNKNYSEKKEELVKILGAKLYQSIFVQKLDLSKIPELSFDDENTLLQVVGNLR